MTIDANEARAALDDIASISQRVRQSQIYQSASLILLLWGGLVIAGNLISFTAPRSAGLAWLCVNIAGLAGTLALLAFTRKGGARAFNPRVASACILFFAFGAFWCFGLAQFSPRATNVFWTTYFMLAYCFAGLFFGNAFIAIGLGVSALTLFGYYAIGAGFDLWMAAVNGGGLILAGCWMRRS